MTATANKVNKVRTKFQNLGKSSYRTKRRRVVSTVSKLLSEIECPTENTYENTDETVTDPLPVQTLLSHVTVNEATTPDQNCVTHADDYVREAEAKECCRTFSTICG